MQKPNPPDKDIGSNKASAALGPIAMAAPLQVIALISGGKDSLFSLLHCLANNHRIIALANLYPPLPPTSFSRESLTDLNSYMYQTVGHALLPHYSTVFSLPLYRHPITGTSIITEKDYSVPSRENESDAVSLADETEDLIPLLQEIIAAHPAANALCTGAILSTYQRTRIESVALRLHLTPLSYLWQYPSLPAPVSSASGLLLDMKAVGMEARIVKVASGGLDESLLWEDVLDERVRRRVEKAVGRFGGSVLGEGGEYETLVVDGPEGVWKGRIEVRKEERWIVKGGGGEAWVGVEGGRVVEEDKNEATGGWGERLRIPGLWDGRFEKLVNELGRGENEVWTEKSCEDCERRHRDEWTVRRCIVSSKSTLAISNMASADIEDDVEGQMTQITRELVTILHDHDRATTDIVFTTILLRSMSDFATINAVYGKLFTKPNPPARVTVACGDALPTGAKIMLSIVVDLGARENRNGLHVQSRSYWAPANIGPYSQAISVKAGEDAETSLVFIAGQIPLIPAAMEVLVSKEGEEKAAGDIMATFRNQAVLSLQHLWRIGTEREVTWWTGAVAFIAGESDVQRKAAFAWMVWKKMHEPPPMEDSADDEEPSGPDAWDRKYGGLGSFSNNEAARHRLPDFETLIYPAGQNSITPGFFAVQVDGIPRGCEVEWQSLGIAGSKVQVQSCKIGELDGARCIAADGSFSITYVGVVLDGTDGICYEQAARVLQSQGSPDGEENSSTLSMDVTVYTARPAAFKDVEGQIVPCRRVWGPEGLELAAGLVLLSRK